MAVGELCDERTRKRIATAGGVHRLNGGGRDRGEAVGVTDQGAIGAEGHDHGGETLTQQGCHQGGRIGFGGGCTEHLQHEGTLVLVDQEGIRLTQLRMTDRDHRREVDHHPTPRQVHRAVETIGGDLTLQQDDAGLFNEPGMPVHIVGVHAGIRAGHDDDGVLTVIGHRDHGQTGGAVDGVDCGHVSAGGTHVYQGGVGHGIGTHRTDHVDLRTELGGGHGLIGALAAGADLTTAAEEGLTGVGVAVDRGGQIRVDGSDNNNGTA
ncbi:hypothetical protein U2A4042610013 [Corynebacterium striatum]|nr:hypothetical protein U2A4042610013 [Corynebacterium striatum]